LTFYKPLLDFLSMTEQSEEIFEQFLTDHGNKRVIAANGYIMSLIENIVELEKNAPPQKDE